MMPDKTIFVCDYDGTYRTGTNAVPEDFDFEAVREFRRGGGIFGIATERDVFEIMAIIGVFRGEYDFIVCSSGACAIVRTDNAAVGVRLGSVGVESELPTQLYCHGLSPYLVYEIAGLIGSVGADSLVVDSAGFAGGIGMAYDMKRQHEEMGGMGCNVHFWDGGSFFQDTVGRDALKYLFPVSRVTARFKNALIADGVVAAIGYSYPDKVAIHRDGTCFDLTVPEASKVYGIRRVLEFLGEDDGGVWTFGDSHRDIGMLREYNGIAVAGSEASAAGVTKYTAKSVAEAVEIAMKR